MPPSNVNSKFGQRDTVERVMPFSANETETIKETVERNNEGLYTLITEVVAAFCHNNSRKRGRGVRGGILRGPLFEMISTPKPRVPSRANFASLFSQHFQPSREGTD